MLYVDILYKEEKMKAIDKTYSYIKVKIKPESLEKICKEFIETNKKAMAAGEYMRARMEQGELLYKLQGRLVMASNTRRSLESESLQDILYSRNPQFINDILKMFNYNTSLYRVHITAPETCSEIMEEGLLIQETDLDYTTCIIDGTDEKLLLSLFNDTHMFQQGIVVVEATNDDIKKLTYPGSQDLWAFKAEVPAQFIKGYIDIANEKVVFNPAFQDRKLFPTGREIAHKTIEDFRSEDVKRDISTPIKADAIEIRSLGKVGLDVWRSKILPEFDPMENRSCGTKAHAIPYWLQEQQEDIVALLQVIGKDVSPTFADVKIAERHQLLTDVYARNKVMAEKIRESLLSKRK